jgi:outer membrane lipoprotein-sorting protein
MLRMLVIPLAVGVLAPALVLGADQPATAKLSAAAIVERNIAARGGSSAWHAVQALSWSGKMDAGGNNQRYLKAPGVPAPPVNDNPAVQVQLPFTLEMKRGRKSRLELQFGGQTAVQVYDGKQGWKVRPFLNRHQVEPYTAEEARVAANAADIGGLLVDSVDNGTKVQVQGLEKVDGKAAYKLQLTLKDGHVLHDWVDARSFLEVKIEGTPRRLDGKIRSVAVYLRDYRNVSGLQIPYLMETTVAGVERTEKVILEEATVNPKLDDSHFAKPT